MRARRSQLVASVMNNTLLSIQPDTLSFSGANALVPDESGLLMLRFRIHAGDSGIEALRHARRSMLREEWTLGRREGEPSLEDAVFTNDAIVWPVWPEQRDMCLERLALLEARVARMLEDPAAMRELSRASRTTISRV